jgi:penicillin amidase
MKKALAILGLVLLILVVALAAAGTWFVRRPWPQVDGALTLPGLLAPVEVIRDRWGVPHIYAQNDHDLFFAQGYVHAQDRLWQMEFNRRVANGTLSAALGEATLETDRFLRTLGLRRAAEKDLVLLDDEIGAILQAYADGVNTYVESHRDRLPLEFTILGVDPAPWAPVDTLAWGKVMSYFLSGNYEYELLRARLIAELGAERTQQLLSPYPQDGPFVIPPEARSYAWLRGTGLAKADSGAAGTPGVLAWLGGTNVDWGSNNWVVHGSRTATGLPLLADDMHLGLDMPSIWYENGLHGGQFDSVGYSFPGVPMVIVGHNQRITWGVTNLMADVQDLYIERLDDPEQPARYEFEGQWHDLEIAREQIEVKGGDPVILEVLITRHGPIVNGVVDGLEDAEPLALRWTALDGSYLFRAVFGLNLAANWEDFRQALRYWDVPGQNFVYADVEGNIGYQTPGHIPLRAPGHQGTVPVPGWTGEYEWLGFIPFEELPSVSNPPTGFVASANNKVVPDDYPHHLASEWAAPYRIQRITDLLTADESVTLEDVRDIHAQTYSLPAEALRPHLLAATPASDLERRALSIVEAWDLRNETDRTGAAIYQVWYWFLVQNTLRDELGQDLMDLYLNFSNMHVPTMVELMAQAGNPWFDDISTPETETRDAMVSQSLSDAIAWLRQAYGDDPEKWTWGRLHTKTFVHQPLGQSGIGLLESLFNSPTIPARGDNFTVDAASYSFNEPFAQGGGVSQRYIADLSDWDNSRSIHTTGQSGHLFHRHRQDLIPLWQNVEYHPLIFSRQAAEASAEAILTLTPP